MQESAAKMQPTASRLGAQRAVSDVVLASAELLSTRTEAKGTCDTYLIDMDGRQEYVQIHRSSTMVRDHLLLFKEDTLCETNRAMKGIVSAPERGNDG